MRFGLGLAAFACAVSLAACSGEKSGALAPLKTTPEKAEAYVTKLAETPFSLKAEGASDLAAVRDALPGAMNLTWATLNFDAATGATVLTNVKLTPKDTPQVGLGIAEVRLWDFDAAFAKARLAGQRLTETGKLARRIDAKGITLFGLETLMAPALDAYTGAISNVIEGQVGPDGAAAVDASLEMKLDSYEFSVGRVIVDDVMLRPFELTPAKLPADAEPDLVQAMPVLQGFAAVMRSIAYDTSAMFDMKGSLAMTQAGQPMKMNVGMKSYGVRGVRGADSDTAFVRGVTVSGTMQEPGMAKPMDISGGVDLYTMEGIRLDKVLAHLARGQWPARTETDLLSLGKITNYNQSIALSGKDIYSVKESTIDASGWHWWIPTKLRFSATDAVYHVDNFIDLVSEMAESMSASQSGGPDAASAQVMAESRATAQQIMGLLKKYGLDKPSMDYTLGWNWNPTTGATVVDGAFGVDSYMRTDLKYEGGLPTFKAVSDLVPDDPEKADGAAIEKVFEATSTMKLVEFSIADEGGLEKIYGLTADAAKLMPVDPSGGMMSGQTPQTLRNMASSAVYLVAESFEQAAPGLKALVAPFGAFLEKGGKVKFTAKPVKPLPLAATGQAIEKGEMTPAEFIKALNAKTVHTPPLPGKP
ncbi:MAG TPA: hypothetical protein VGO52_10600 [Hyphomonadaceae bacterium]|jgi:hypothetical protein|nr:hypothetical protein [Hyphomonadaceae bacterium]